MTTDWEARGLFTQIPFTDTYSGWICYNDPTITFPNTTIDFSVVCRNHFLESSNLPTPLLTANNIGTWACEAPVADASNVQIVECRNNLPDEIGNREYPQGTYRWAPRDGQVEQYGYRQTNGSTSEWIKLGLVTLQRASILSSEICILLSIFAITTQF